MPTLIPAATRTLSVFEIFAREKRALTKSNVARLHPVAGTSCLDLRHTFHPLGYLMRTPKSRKYHRFSLPEPTERMQKCRDAYLVAQRKIAVQMLS